MADYNGTVETYPDGRGFNVEGPADGPQEETFDRIAYQNYLSFGFTIDIRTEPNVPRGEP